MQEDANFKPSLGYRMKSHPPSSKKKVRSNDIWNEWSGAEWDTWLILQFRKQIQQKYFANFIANIQLVWTHYFLVPNFQKTR